MTGFWSGRSGDRKQLYRLLSQCLQSGLPLREAARISSERSGSARFQLFAEALQGPASFEEALQCASAAPRAEQLALIAAHEHGNLPEALEAIAGDLETLQRLRREILQRTAYPLLVLHLVPPALSTPLLVTAPVGIHRRGRSELGSPLGRRRTGVAGSPQAEHSGRISRDPGQASRAGIVPAGPRSPSVRALTPVDVLGGNSLPAGRRGGGRCGRGLRPRGGVSPRGESCPARGVDVACPAPVDQP